MYDGREYIVDPSGTYTFAHYYFHPDQGRRVVLTGTCHVADAIFYEQIRKILSPCDLVLSEHFTLGQVQRHERIAWIKEQIFSVSIEDAFYSAVMYGPTGLAYMLGLCDENDALQNEYSLPHWVNVDLLVSARSKIRETYDEDLKERWRDISILVKERIVAYFRDVIERIARDDFRKSELQEAERLTDGDEFEVPVKEILVFPRDASCFVEFDRLVEERRPEFVGIKFGCGHTKSQRSLLEARGYVYEKSIRLQAIAF
ncbi:MAG: hypothetical protein WAP23_04300 [Candidatus Spechtbacterales bacterium]